METPTFLYKPNFCAECGEKIERESWHFWSSRRFCENCEPVYRMNRIFPVALAGIVLFFGGMFFGQMGRLNEKANPVISTQAALVTERSAPPSPQKLFAAEQRPNQAANQAANQMPAENVPPVDAARPRATGNLSDKPAPVYTAVYTCGARTQKGTPCSRRVKVSGTRCWQHLGKPSMPEKPYH